MTSGAALKVHIALAEAPQRIPLILEVAAVSFLAVAAVAYEAI
jgi:hypothetical protein